LPVIKHKIQTVSARLTEALK